MFNSRTIPCLSVGGLYMSCPDDEPKLPSVALLQLTAPAARLPKPVSQWVKPTLIRENKPFINPIILGDVMICASGATKPAADTTPGGLCSGKKNEKTVGIACAIIPITVSRFENSTNGVVANGVNSRALITAMTFNKGSRSDPWEGSESRQGAVASGWRTMAATVAAISPYRPLPKVNPFDLFAPDWKASATDSTKVGLGLENPKRCINLVAMNGAVFWW
mmetsp:Transcript_11675/g.17828  ORF Transcript_11675/g.17828 Transcript_11675/m.17828 type:complete len:221 (+) Transcript_11675:1561-2223(+)